MQETLVIPMYGRKMCSQLYPKIYRDETALRLIDQVDYDFSALEEKAKSIMHRFGFLEVAMRQSDLAWEIRDYLKTHPNAAVVNLGCGLDDTAAPATTARVKSITSIFRMSSRCAMRCFRPGSGKPTSAAI